MEGFRVQGLGPRALSLLLGSFPHTVRVLNKMGLYQEDTTTPIAYCGNSYCKAEWPTLCS